MLYGGVTYRLKANPENDVYVPWAGRAVFAPEREGEGVQMLFYQVYLVGPSHLPPGGLGGFGGGGSSADVCFVIGSFGAGWEEIRVCRGLVVGMVV